MSQGVQLRQEAPKTGASEVATLETVSREAEVSDGLTYSGRDRAAEFVNAIGGPVAVTAQDNQRVLRKIDLVILPIILGIYFLQSLDKTALSYAAVFGIIKDAHLVGDQYSWLGAIVYLAQLVMQPAVAYFLVKLPIGKFTGVMVLCWGAVLCLMAAAKDFGGLMATRFFLGAFEASIAPAFVAIVQMWYRRSEQTNRNAAWYSMLGVVNMLGSLLSYGLAHIQSSILRPYQIIFLFCGALTVVFSIFIFLVLSDSPIEAKFLKSDHDKLVAIERLRMNQMGISSRQWKWEHVWEAFADVKTYLWFCMITAIAIPSGGISTFGPLIVESFGFDSFTTILFNIPFGAVQFVATLGSAYLATLWKVKSALLIALCLPPIAGCVMLLVVEHDKAHRGILLAGYYIISVYPAISPLIYSWSAQNTAGDTKRKVTTGILFVGQSVGNVVGPHLYQPSEAPKYTRGLTSNLALFVVLIALVCVGILVIWILNAKHARMRVSMGKAEKVVDLSMKAQKDARNKGEVLNESEGAVGDKAFEDITDLENEDFIYLY
ncbi:MAG: hypothetical protein M1821_007561 [Bathelium mastoideum]|nr:MAG: hypothetical protein M1821_007561 [Bathelium mastoideum]